jgi:sugar lactone lactonase YvrE
VDTPTKRITRLVSDPASGTFTGWEPFVEVDGHPDGVAADAEGGVWAALYGGSAVHRFDAQGRLTDIAELPCTQVTCPAFGGSGLDELYVTTSRRGLPEHEQPAAGALFRVRPRVGGAPVLPFAG